MPLGLGILYKAYLLFFSDIFSRDLFFDVLIVGLLDLFIYGPGSWTSGLRPYILTKIKQSTARIS